jgi:ribosomal protein L7/L12
MNEIEVRNIVEPLLVGRTITKVEDFGDVFAVHFINDEYYKSKRMEDMAVGAGPVICIKESKEIFKTGSGNTSEGYITAYRECGDVYGSQDKSIEISIVPDGVDKKQCILKFKKILGVNLTEAKDLAEKLWAKDAVKIELKDYWQARDTTKLLSELGYTVKHVWNKSY